MRMGIFAEKIGMSRLFDDVGNHIPVTLLKVKDCKIIDHKTKEKHGYTAVVVAFDEVKEKKINKPQIEYFKKNNLPLYKNIKEFIVKDLKDIELGKSIDINNFIVGQFIDVVSISKGKGFAGAMKRHNFGGLRASHGVSVTHRSHGSTGNRTEPGRVFKGKKMAGHMGDKRVTVQNLKVVKIDENKGLILVKGGIPGGKGALVRVLDAVKKSTPSEAKYPVAVK